MKIVLRRRKIQSIFSVSMSPFGLHLRSGILMCTYESLLIIPCRRRLLDRELSMETASSYSSCRKFLFRQKNARSFSLFLHARASDCVSLHNAHRHTRTFLSLLSFILCYHVRAKIV